MEQKFKVGDWVRCIEPTERAYRQTGKITFVGSLMYIADFTQYSNYNVYEHHLELAYPSDHDILDYAARDSKIAELTAENEALKAELEKWKPKPESMTIDLYLYRDENYKLDWSYGTPDTVPRARKTVTITEGEGM